MLISNPGDQAKKTSRQIVHLVGFFCALMSSWSLAVSGALAKHRRVHVTSQLFGGRKRSVGRMPLAQRAGFAKVAAHARVLGRLAAHWEPPAVCASTVQAQRCCLWRRAWRCRGRWLGPRAEALRRHGLRFGYGGETGVCSLVTKRRARWARLGDGPLVGGAPPPRRGCRYRCRCRCVRAAGRRRVLRGRIKQSGERQGVCRQLDAPSLTT